MRLILIVLFSLITVTGFSQRKKSDSNATAVSAFGPELTAALKLAASEQYENAGLAFEALLKKEPANGDVYFYYGETILKEYLSDTLSNSLKEMANKADQLFKKGIAQDPANQINNVGLGSIVLFLKSDTVAADKYFSLAEAALPTKLKLMSPRDARILTKLGTSQLLGSVNRFNRQSIILQELRKLIQIMQQFTLQWVMCTSCRTMLKMHLRVITDHSILILNRHYQKLKLVIFTCAPQI